MTSMLVGYTGFVGSNLDTGAVECGRPFSDRINTKNQEEAYGKKPDLLIYAGLRAEKFLANQDPEKDFRQIEAAMHQIEKIDPKKIVLISTIDVYQTPVNVDEDTAIQTKELSPYGYHRYQMEKWVRDQREDALIVRLPGLYGNHLKKNFIYDLIHVVPSLLNKEKYEELSGKSQIIARSYQEQENGFFRCMVSDDEKELFEELKSEFQKVGFTAVHFTDSRGVFQFYHLKNLYKDIMTALKWDIPLLNVSTQPVGVSEIYTRITGKVFCNEIAKKPPFYDYRSKHAELFGGKDGYFSTKEQVLNEIETFVRSR